MQKERCLVLLQENTAWVSACPDYLVQVHPTCNNKFLSDVSSMEVIVGKRPVPTELGVDSS